MLKLHILATVTLMAVCGPLAFSSTIGVVSSTLRDSGGHKGMTEAPSISNSNLGITIITLTPKMLTDLRMRNIEMPSDLEHRGLVREVIIGSPVHNGGLQPGDIIIHVNGKAVQAASDIYELLENTSGSSYIDVFRGIQRIILSISPQKQ